LWTAIPVPATSSAVAITRPKPSGGLTVTTRLLDAR
jgi:hypothetical protein